MIPALDLEEEARVIADFLSQLGPRDVSRTCGTGVRAKLVSRRSSETFASRHPPTPSDASAAAADTTPKASRHREGRLGQAVEPAAPTSLPAATVVAIPPF